MFTVSANCMANQMSYTMGEPNGFITSLSFTDCTYVIQVQSGQRIELTLYDFQSLIGAMHRGRDATCVIYATVHEDDASDREPDRKVICAKTSRETVVYLSLASKIYVTVHGSSSDEAKFLLKYSGKLVPD